MHVKTKVHVKTKLRKRKSSVTVEFAAGKFRCLGNQSQMLIMNVYFHS